MAELSVPDLERFLPIVYTVDDEEAHDCPNKALEGTVTAKGKGNNPPNAQALQKIMEKGLDAFDKVMKPRMKCADYVCADADCVYDSRLVGTPTVTQTAGGPGHLHGAKFDASWKAVQNVEYGCFCLKEA